MRVIVLLALIAVFLHSNLANAENWPGWRGPRHDGSIADSKLPLKWSSTENVLWKAPIAGIAHSSPIVWDDRIFVTTCTTDDLSRRLICLNRETGSQLWDKVVAVSPIEKMHRDNTPASATPVTDGSHVYTAFQVDQKIHVAAFTTDGILAWERMAGNFESRHGFCTSLVLDGNKLFVSGLQDGEDSFLSAVDKSTGDTIWKTARNEKIRSFSSPFPCLVGKSKALLLSGANQTVAYERDSGKVLWEVDGPAEKTVSSIVACPESNMAYVCGGRDNGFLALSLAATPTKSPEVCWEAKRGIPYMTSPLASKGIVHILSDEGVYRCYDGKSAKVLNELRPVGDVRASMIANDDYILVTEKNGKTTIIKNDPTWTVIAENEIGEEVNASLAVSNGDLLIRGDQHLYLIR